MLRHQDLQPCSVIYVIPELMLKTRRSGPRRDTHHRPFVQHPVTQLRVIQRRISLLVARHVREDG